MDSSYIDTFTCENSLMPNAFYVYYILIKSLKICGKPDIFHALVMTCHSKLSWNNVAWIHLPNSKSDRREVWFLKSCLPSTSEISLFLYEHLGISGAPGARPKFIVL